LEIIEGMRGEDIVFVNVGDQEFKLMLDTGSGNIYLQTLSEVWNQIERKSYKQSFKPWGL